MEINFHITIIHFHILVRYKKNTTVQNFTNFRFFFRCRHARKKCLFDIHDDVWKIFFIGIHLKMCSFSKLISIWQRKKTRTLHFVIFFRNYSLFFKWSIKEHWYSIRNLHINWPHSFKFCLKMTLNTVYLCYASKTRNLS